MTLGQRSHLRDRFMALGCSTNLAAAMSAEVSLWVEKSGINWTVKRLKMLKTSFLRRIAGEDYVLPYVATRRDAKGPIPKGAFGQLWNSTGSDMTSISRALNCMMVYSTFISDTLTVEQLKKFNDSAKRQPPLDSDIKHVIDMLRFPKWFRVKDAKLEPIEQFVVRKGYSPSYVSRALNQFIDSDTGQALWAEFPQYLEVFNTIAKPVDTRIAFDDYLGIHPVLNSRSTRDPVGRLGYSQEPGYKLRVFASPNIVHQCAMSRLKRQLFHLIAQVNWDCTYNQSKGTDWLRVQLNQDRKVWSIDLSDATNNFPLDLQLHVLREIGCAEEDVELFHRLSRAPWSNSNGVEKETMRWTVGQPLGLGPSFAAFALTHGLLVWSIARACQVTDCFRVLGDDIVISDERVALQYLEVLAKIGIPVSKDKTISSSHYAEFAGKVVSRDGTIATLKWRDPSDRSFLDVVRLLGPRSLQLLKRRQRRVATLVSILPEPQGFGWNPQGISLDKRLALLQVFEEASMERQRTYHPLERQWTKIRLGLEQPFLRLDFAWYPEGSWRDNVVAKGPLRLESHEPTPVGSVEHLLRLSRMTGCPLRLPESRATPAAEKYLRSEGFLALTLSTDVRGLNPLEHLERVITTNRKVIEQIGLKSLLS